MKNFHIVVNVGSFCVGNYFKAEDEVIAMNMAKSYFSKTCNIPCDEIFVVACEEI